MRQTLVVLVLASLLIGAAEKKAIGEKQAVAIARAEVKKREGWRNTDARAAMLDGQWVVTVHQDENTPGIYRVVILSLDGALMKYQAGN
jgi:hypothetical protein